MKSLLKQSCIILGVIFILQSCEENPTFLEENAQMGKGYYPVLSNVFGYEDQYKPGANIMFSMEYFSQGEIDTITLDEIIVKSNGDTTRSQVFSKSGDAGTFIDSLDVNTLDISYTVPQAPDSTTITLKSKITNKNTLADSLSFTFTVISD